MSSSPLIASAALMARLPGTGFDFADADAARTKNRAVAHGANSSGSGNSWNLAGSWSFVSTNPSKVTGARLADGSIPSSTFLHPCSARI